MTRIQTVLNALSTQPKTMSEIKAALGSSETAILGILETLERGGYVQQAVPPAAAGCGHCNLKSLCRVADADPQELKLHLYRLTARGAAQLSETP